MTSEKKLCLLLTTLCCLCATLSANTDHNECESGIVAGERGIFHCPRLNDTKITIEFLRSIQSLDIFCHTKDDGDYQLLPILDVNSILLVAPNSTGSINRIMFHECSLPSRGFQWIFNRLGVDTAEEIVFNRPTSLDRIVFQSEHFAGIESRVKCMEIESHADTALGAGVFDGFSSLKYLWINISTSTLPPKVFHQLHELNFLYLGNGITDIDPELLINQKQLITLRLDGNDGDHLKKKFFQPLHSLKILDIFHYKSTSLNSNVFDDLAGLTDVHLNRNNFESLPAD